MQPNERVYDPKLDRLYMKKIKCPYCRNRIQSMQTTCSRCGLNKIQIANASNQKAKQIMREKTGEKIVMIQHRPNDVKMSALAPRLLFGLFGTHNFYVGRRTRGFIMLLFMLVFIVEVLVFSPGMNGTNIHPWREACENIGLVFPLDYLGVASFIMWAMDSFAIVFGRFKYPVRLGDNK